MKARLHLAGLLLIHGGALACNSDPAVASATACEHVYGECPKDPPPTSENVTDCAAVLGGACGPLMRIYTTCLAGKCNDAGHADLGAVTFDCSTEFAAYRSCTLGDAGVDAPPD